MACSDEELMRRAAADDPAALGELFDRHYAGLFAFLCRFLGDVPSAEDVAQEVFWRVWQYRTSFDSRKPFASWIYVIARHAALDEIRGRGRRANAFSELTRSQEREVEAAGALGFEDTLVEEWSVTDQVCAALQALPPEQRLCVILREYEGKSHREIGEILGCSEGNARVITHRARRALRQLLQPLIGSMESEETRV